MSPGSVPTPADLRLAKLMGDDNRCSVSLLLTGPAGGVRIKSWDVSMPSGAVLLAGEAVFLEGCMIKYCRKVMKEERKKATRTINNRVV